jgi:hypothetical protein
MGGVLEHLCPMDTFLVYMCLTIINIFLWQARSDGEHKVVKSKYAEDEEILRVPISLAMVKLLQNLPRGALGRYLPG